MDSEKQQAYAEVEGRRLTLSQLADYLDTQRIAVTDQWLLAVRRDPEIAAADRLTHEQLVDHLPEIYQECCTFLRTRDAAILMEDARSDAKIHGGIRWTDGYRIDEVIRELEVFRRVLASTIARYGDVDPRFRGPIESSASALVHQFFGEVTVNSVAQYAQEQQRVIGTYTSELEAANRDLGRANANLAQALNERQRLTAIVAHEVRNFLQQFKYSTQVPASPQRRMDSASVQLKDLEELLEQLLEHSALIANRDPISLAEFDSATLHEELMGVYRPIAHQKGIALIGACSAAPARIHGDRQKIKQIASNLLSNALKCTAEGHVSLTFAGHEPGRWGLRVSDTGPGLTAEAAERLFGDLAGTSETVPRGGIGLAITKDLANLLGGTLQVVTKSGAGTVIEVLLPIVSAGDHDGPGTIRP